ncbi:MAG: type 4a pilus biogenesis protein PilO [Fibrobacterota bacterium]|nr:type 4a pilus biogenesis protein PilO [Fibrobacterota bacterium]QQS07424.1 MAG: type 4a pilus biogenesis protein PilO [Fibrobacterota bacterium]
MATRIDLKDRLTVYLVFCVLVAVGVGYYHWMYIATPRYQHIDELNAEQQKLSQELTVVRTQTQRLVQIREELKNAEVEFAKLQEMFPDREKIPSRLQDLLTVTRRAGTVTTKFVPQPSVQQKYYAENNYKIAIAGNYHSIGEMFAEFANFKYPTSIQKMNIVVSPNLKTELESADKHGTVPTTVAAEFDFTTYTSGK